VVKQAEYIFLLKQKQILSSPRIDGMKASRLARHRRYAADMA
jgi:hypothetical protein